MPRCVVTGVAGFIGSQVAQQLVAEGCEVTGFDCFTDYYDPKYKHTNLKELLASPRFSFFESDLSQPFTLPAGRIDCVFHFAAQPGVRTSWGAGFEDYVRHNIVATQMLLEVLRDREVQRLIVASSSSVYGAPTSFPVAEDDPVAPVSPYGVTKLAAENLCFAYAREYGILVSALRYFTVYGPRQRPDMALHRFLRAIMSRRSVTLYGSGAEARDYTYVGDVVRATVACMRANVTGIFNIAGGSVITLEECIEVLRGVTGLPVSVEHRARQKGDPTRTEACTKKAQRDLAFTSQVPFREGIQHEWDWLRRLNV